MSVGMKPIGGYFELELPTGREMYANLIGVNSARNALVYVIKAMQVRTINMPYFNCHVVVDAVNRYCPETSISYYHVDANFMPIFDGITPGVPLYYVNYYGLQQSVLQELTDLHVILDNSQAFYSPPIVNGETIYCPRKFFGVSDGGYLKTSGALDQSLECDTSWDHAMHLLKRIDCGAPAAYADFQASEAALKGRPLMGMSRLTRRILSAIDYEAIRGRRRANFAQLHSAIGESNRLESLIGSASVAYSFVPLCYPYMVDNAELVRKRLIEKKIYVPIYWPELKASHELNQVEHDFVNKIVCIPIDQRYGEVEMQDILEVIKETPF